MKTIIELTGMPASGKSTLAAMLEKKGIKVVRMGDAVRREMLEKGMKLNNVTLRKYVVSVRRKFGNNYILNLVKKDVDVALKTSDMVVLDGPRNISEAEYFRKRGYSVFIIGVVADRLQRYERILKRHNSTDMTSLKEFEWREKQELKLGTSEILAFSDFFIHNNGSETDLGVKMDEVFRKIGTFGPKS